MTYGLSILAQDSFGGGIFRGRRAPGNSVYDALNALVDDEGNLFERGASVYKSNAATAAALAGLAAVQTALGQRTFFWDAAVANWKSYALDTDDATPVQVGVTGDVSSPAALQRVVAAGGVVFFIAHPSSGVTPGGTIGYYAGGRTSAPYFAGTIASLTKGSTVMVGAGTSWLGNVQPGMATFFGGYPAVVAEVVSDTQITLTEPWAGPSAGPGIQYILASRGAPAIDPIANLAAIAAVGSPARLLAGAGAKVFFSEPGAPGTILPTNYHQLPEAAVIVGMDAILNAAIVFTTAGVWTISNMDLDVFDAAGNIQQQVGQVSKDVILWGDPGIAAWGNVLLVPAMDDVYLFGLDSAPVPLSAAIRPLYRSYVKAGYKPGIAAVHRAHYFLPIVDDANALIDVLVCRLDLRDSKGNVAPAWTRLSGHAACIAYAQRVGATTRQPKLFGIKGTRVLDLSNLVDTPGTGTDADGTIPTFDVITRDLATGGGSRGATCRKVRIDYELAGTTPGVSAAVAEGAVDAAFTDLTDPQASFGASDGTVPATWKVNRKAPAVRFRFRSTSANTKLIVRGVEMHARPTGKA